MACGGIGLARNSLVREVRATFNTMSSAAIDHQSLSTEPLWFESQGRSDGPIRIGDFRITIESRAMPGVGRLRPQPRPWSWWQRRSQAAPSQRDGSRGSGSGSTPAAKPAVHSGLVAELRSAGPHDIGGERALSAFEPLRLKVDGTTIGQAALTVETETAATESQRPNGSRTAARAAALKAVAVKTSANRADNSAGAGSDATPHPTGVAHDRAPSLKTATLAHPALAHPTSAGADLRSPSLEGPIGSARWRSLASTARDDHGAGMAQLTLTTTARYLTFTTTAQSRRRPPHRWIQAAVGRAPAPPVPVGRATPSPTAPAPPTPPAPRERPDRPDRHHHHHTPPTTNTPITTTPHNADHDHHPAHDHHDAPRDHDHHAAHDHHDADHDHHTDHDRHCHSNPRYITRQPCPPPSSGVYFGAYIEGQQTFGYYYQSEAPWSNAPWDTRTWDRFEHDAGKKVALLMFGQPAFWLDPFNYDGAFDDTAARVPSPSST